MGRKVHTILAILAVAILASTVFAQTGADLQEQARKKAMAIGAARADAIRKLTARINGLRITADMTVHDFVTESDSIRTSMDSWLRGMKEVGQPRFDGEEAIVEMQVTLKTVIRKLKQFYSAHYKGDKVKINSFEKMTELNKYDIITEEGHGVVPEDLKEEPLLAKGSSSGAIPPIWQKYCTARGRLMAVEAARADALRKLAQRISGVRVTAETTVQDYVTQSDDINLRMDTFVRGAKELGIRYHRDELIVEVEMQIVLKTVLTKFKSWADAHYKGDKVKMTALEEKIEKVRHDKIVETGMGVPPQKYLKDYQPEELVVVERVRETVAQTPAWVSETIRATGEAAVDTEAENKVQGELMAKRAAEMDARRKLAEQVQGLMLTGDTSVKNFMLKNDQVRSRMEAYQLGAKLVDAEVKDGKATAEVELDLKPIWQMWIVFIKQQR
ncbi:MAG: LPP20 family lipoprotein [Phycisphaerae bacterium]|nr:LPP20 family lipoprotein [Phycisphaerae bacterium]